MTVCGCELQAPGGRGRVGEGVRPVDAFADVQSGIKITGLKVFGVSLTPNSDRPYVFVKIETNQGLIGWGEGTLEGKAGAVMACVNDFKDFLIGSDPMQVEHIWQDHVCPLLLPGRAGDGIRHLGHRSGSLGHSRQSHGNAGV